MEESENRLQGMYVSLLFSILNHILCEPDKVFPDRYE